jgi:hypothetical protein
MSAWQPIESYHDGAYMIVVWNGEREFFGFYQEPDGWFADQDGELVRIDPPPTHWMPLPEPPTEDANTEQKR